METDTIYRKLQRMGYIESELLQLQKKNDSSYVANFFLGRKYSQLKVFYSEEDFSKKELQRVSSEITETYFILPFETVPIRSRKTYRAPQPKRKRICATKIAVTEIEIDKKQSICLLYCW